MEPPWRVERESGMRAVKDEGRSTMTTAAFYVTGGSLPSGTLSYVEREADRELFEALSAGEFCYVLTARQMGKSSLMVRTAERLRDAGVRVAVLDLTAIGQNVSVEQWYYTLLCRLGEKLGVEEALDDFWQAHPSLTPLRRFVAAVEQCVLGSAEGSGFRVQEAPGGLVSSRVGEGPTTTTPHQPANSPARIVVFIDEIDVVRSLPFSTDEFFAAIRECYNRRTEDPAFERLTFCLLGVASPSDLIRDTQTTPFNIGRRIELNDFTAEEAALLRIGLALGRVDSFGRSDGQAAPLLARVLYWTGGHPYLTQQLCRTVAEDRRVTDAAGVDRSCLELFLSAQARERDDNLLFVRERILRSEVDLAALLELYGKVLAGRRVAAEDTTRLSDVLRLSGIVRLRIADCGLRLGSNELLPNPQSAIRNPQLTVRNRIYARVFDREWVRRQMPDAEVRRQRAAYRRGVLRASALGSAVLAMMGGLALTAVSEARRAIVAGRLAVRRANEATRNLYNANMNLIQFDWKSANLGRVRELLEETRESPGRGFEWGYWNRLCNLDLRTLAGHSGPVYSACYSPDGGRIATASGDGTARCWDAKTGSRILTIAAHSGNVSHVCFSPDGQRIGTAGNLDGTARIWDAATGRELLTVRHDGVVRAVAFSPEGQRIATASFDGTARVWNASTGKALLTLKGHGENVDDVCFSPDGRRIATAGDDDATARIWDSATGRELQTVRHAGGLDAVSFSPDSRRLVTSHRDGTATIWDVATGREFTRLRGGPNLDLKAADFSPDGRRIVTGGMDHLARVWDTRSGRELFTLKGHALVVSSVRFSPDGRRILTASLDGTARIWDAAGPQETGTLAGHQGWVSCVRFSPDGLRIATGSVDHTVKVWDSRSGGEIRTLAGHSGMVWSVAFSRDGHRMVTASEDGTARLWDAASGRELRVLSDRTRRSARAEGIDVGPEGAASFSPDGRRVVIGGGEDRTAKVWDTTTGRELLTLRGHSRPVRTAAFSPDGRRILTCSGDGTARVSDAATGREILAISPGGTPGTAPLMNVLYSAAYSPDGQRIATASGTGLATGFAHVWDAATGRRLLTLRGHTRRVVFIAFSADGQRIVTGAGLGEIKLWDAATGRELLTLIGDPKPVVSAALSPDGRRLVTASRGESAVVWFAD